MPAHPRAQRRGRRPVSTTLHDRVNTRTHPPPRQPARVAGGPAHWCSRSVDQPAAMLAAGGALATARVRGDDLWAHHPQAFAAHLERPPRLRQPGPWQHARLATRRAAAAIALKDRAVTIAAALDLGGRLAGCGPGGRRQGRDGRVLAGGGSPWFARRRARVRSPAQVGRAEANHDLRRAHPFAVTAARKPRQQRRQRQPRDPGQDQARCSPDKSNDQSPHRLNGRSPPGLRERVAPLFHRSRLTRRPWPPILLATAPLVVSTGFPAGRLHAPCSGPALADARPLFLAKNSRRPRSNDHRSILPMPHGRRRRCRRSP